MRMLASKRYTRGYCSKAILDPNFDRLQIVDFYTHLASTRKNVKSISRPSSLLELSLNHLLFKLFLHGTSLPLVMNIQSNPPERII